MASNLLQNLPEPLASLSPVALIGLVVVVSALILILALPAGKSTRVALHPEEWRKFKLIKKTSVTHNVVCFRFALQTPETVLGLPIGQHISIQGVGDDGKTFSRPYTPTTLDSDVGFVDLVIKIYPEGAMSQFLVKREVGDLVNMRGPKGRFRYSPNMCTELGMIAGGTGITPMYQVARAILKNPADTTKLSLIFGNVTADDILLKDELEAMARSAPGRFSVFHVLNKPPEGWTGGVGFVTKEIIAAHLPPPSSKIKVLRCGPPPMNKAMAAALESLGYTEDMLFQF